MEVRSAPRRVTMSTRRKILLAALALVLGLGVLAVLEIRRLADLRPPALIGEGVTPERASRGRMLLQRLEDAHGGFAAWRRHAYAQVELRDRWPGRVMPALAMPWRESGLLTRGTLQLGTANSRLDFLEGPDAGGAWGIQQWMTYRITGGGEPIFEDDDTIRFWLPTLQYFFEAPFRLREGDVVADAGPETLEGITYERVFVSWHSAAPRASTDQYLAWIHPETGRLAFLEYTVRDMLPSLVGCMQYRDYSRIEGLWVAMTMAVVEGPGGPDALHRFELEQVRFDDVSESFVVPRPDLSRAKHG